MTRWIALPVFFIASTLRAAPPPTTPERDIGAKVLRVFATKCAACHGSVLAKPQGRFGYVLDLGKVANNPEMVIPSRPEESELWILVNRSEMPPPDSASGPLTTEQKETVRAWIEAGSPDAKFPMPERGNAIVAPESSLSEPAGVSMSGRALRLLGKFHLLLLHLPIALMLAAGAGEITAMWRGSRVPSPVVQFCLTLAAIAAVPTVALGWLHAAAGNGAGSLLTLHRWFGTLAGVWVVGTALWAWRDARRGVRSKGVQMALAIGIALVVATAHFGGLMIHGRDFFDW